MHFMENHKIPRNYTKIQKISVLHNSVILHETFVFPRPNGWSRAMGPPKPGNNQNSTKLVEFHYFNEITLNFSDFSRILGKSVFERLGGFLAAPC
jgi:hypothetical protein